MEMPFASILNSLLPRVRSRSRAFVVCVSMMKYHRVGHPLSSIFPFIPRGIRKRELGRVPPIDLRFFNSTDRHTGLDKRCNDGMEGLV